MRILAVIFAAGLGAVAAQVIATLLAALSIALFDRGVRSHFGDDIGWTPAGLFLAITLAAITYPIATAGNLGAPALAAATLALLYVTTSGSTLAAGICGASLAFAAEVHPVTLLGVPVAILTIGVSCRRPIRALALGFASGIAAASALSLHGWIGNARALLAEPWCVPLVVGSLALTLVVAAGVRPRWLALDIGRRRILLLVAIVGSVVAEMVAASLVARRSLLGVHYLLFAFPALAILIGLGLRRWRVRGGAARRAALAVPVVLLSLHPAMGLAWRFGVATGAVPMPLYSMRQAEILARHLWANGYAYPDVQRHLRGPQVYDLLGALAVFAPDADGSSERPMPDLRLLTFAAGSRPGDPIPSGGQELDLGRGRRAWILPLEGWVRLAPARACFEPGSTERDEPDCVDIESASIAYTGRYRDLHERWFPALREAHRRSNGRGGSAGRRFRWEFPIELSGDDEERHIDIVGVIGVPPWRIERVEGVAYRGALPARHVVLERGGQRSGRLVLAAAPSDLPLKEYPPDFLETRPGETALRRSLQQLPPLGRRICEPLGTCPDRTPEAGS